MMETNQDSSASESELRCDICQQTDNCVEKKPTATAHCIVCCENYCHKCSQLHKKINLTKHHTIFPIDEFLKTEIKKSKSIVRSTPEVGRTIGRASDQTELESNRDDVSVGLSATNCIHCSEIHCTECSCIHRKQKSPKDRERIALDEAMKQLKSKDHLEPHETHRSSGIESSVHRCAQIKRGIVQNMGPLVEDEEYSKLHPIEEKPSIQEEALENFWPIALPYIIQRIRMWNGNVHSAQNLNSLVTRPQKSNSTSTRERGYKAVKNKTCMHSVSRLDVLTYTINAADFIVARDILRVLSKFPVAIPLIVQDIKNDGRYVVSIPLIQNVVVKLESIPGKIVENHLFSSPFRMVVAVRLGDNKRGKSTILNQLMRKQYTFSSSCEPGSRYGRPLTLDGSVEIVWLTQETCNDATWEICLKGYYKGNSSAIAILANLHGDAMMYTDTLRFLLQLSCSFIVFLMPGFSHIHWDQLKQLLSGKKAVHVLVDPEESMQEDFSFLTIDTTNICSEDTQETIRDLLQESLDLVRMFQFPSLNPDNYLIKSLGYIKALDDENAAKIVEFVQQRGSLATKQLLGSLETESSLNQDLKYLITLFIAVVRCPVKRVKQSLCHVEAHLSQQSDKESAPIRSEVSAIQDNMRRIATAHQRLTMDGTGDVKGHDQEMKEAQERLKSALVKAGNINLGEEHFFRVIGKIYEDGQIDERINKLFRIHDLPNCFAELLINGHAMELLNGDSGEILLTWMKAICESVSRKLPNFKVYVISIIGLQSSGKSTLLNALFSGRFAVSVGRCSRGLFMRMILLDENLRKTCRCDAVILIDTEGFCSPLKMNDPKASHYDNLMATYAMGVSNLTIVNILGEGMTEMTEILQIAIVGMARLQEGKIRPDILIVQHLQERNDVKFAQGEIQFREAINKAFELIKTNDVELATASSECLIELRKRIESGDLFHYFGPFKNGASVNSPPSESYHEDIVELFKTLIKRIELSNNKNIFDRWSNHFESFWGCVKEENFALNFKNVKHITDFLYFEKKIAKVKELLERAVRKHREMFSIQIRGEISSCLARNEKIRADILKSRMIESIEQTYLLVPHSCPSNCEFCDEFISHYTSLLQEISSTEWEENTKLQFKMYTNRLHESAMKMLKQIFDGSVVKQGCFSIYSDVITQQLKRALEEKPDGIYSQEQQQIITKNIWSVLENTARDKESRSEPDTRFYQALNNEYAINGILPNIVRDFENEKTCEKLFRKNNYYDQKVHEFQYPVFKCLREGKFTENLKDSLSKTINNVVTEVFISIGGNDYLETGLDFEEAMVARIRLDFPNAIKKYEKRFLVNLEDSFKKTLQIYVLQQFNKHMTDLQHTWNKQNRPFDILMEKKKDYLIEIETRLKSGFSAAGEGEFIAARLHKATKKAAIKAAHDENVEAVKGLEWTTNSEKVRLLYFEQLAKEVNSGMKDRALRHFLNPTSEIENWYKKKVNSILPREELMEIYYNTISTELNRIQREISKSCSKMEIDKILQKHITDAEDHYFSKLDPKDHDFDAFLASTVFHLKCYSDQVDEDVVIPLVSDESEIKGRLGCTEYCPWCRALCWGARNHQMEKYKNSEMECHHSCHQPMGLNGTHYKESKKLRSHSCHTMADTYPVFFGEFNEGSGIPWSVAKRDYFSDWKFDVHCITKFDELMRWFFQELHQDIAQHWGYLPANNSELRQYKCENLKLDDILKVVRSKI